MGKDWEMGAVPCRQSCRSRFTTKRIIQDPNRPVTSTWTSLAWKCDKRSSVFCHFRSRERGENTDAPAVRRFHRSISVIRKSPPPTCSRAPSCFSCLSSLCASLSRAFGESGPRRHQAVRKSWESRSGALGKRNEDSRVAREETW